MVGRETEKKLTDALFDELWPLLRSITGAGVRQTHDIIGRHIPLTRHEYPSGSKVLDWTIPREWRCVQAYVEAPDGTRIADVQENNLHILNYSVPFCGTLSRWELEPHLHTRSDLPDAIPYMTSYYSERWGFCISETRKNALPEGDYKVVVDTELFDGSLTISDCILPGSEPGEILISTYTCHPSMANNELSGPLLAVALYRRLAALPERRWTYRFVFNPETIGSIAYLHHHGDALRQNLVAGIVLTCVGDDGPYSVKFSRRGDTAIDRIARLAVGRRDNHQMVDFYPALGSDERQYCSPGFNFPLVVFMRSLPARFKEYHTSLDNRDIVSADNISNSCDCLYEMIEALELNRAYLNLIPDGEPQLGRRGLYGDAPGGTRMSTTDFIGAILWVMNYSDGDHDLLDISEKSGIPIRELALAAERCIEAGILAPRDDPAAGVTR